MWRVLDLAAWPRRYLVLLTLAIALGMFLIDLGRGRVTLWRITPTEPPLVAERQAGHGEPSQVTAHVDEPRNFRQPNGHIVEYADIAADFEARFNGPFVIRTNARRLFFAPGIALSPAQKEAARAISIDVAVSPTGEASWAYAGEPSDGTKIPPRDATVRGHVGFWTFKPFDGWGRYGPLIIKNVPVHLLMAESNRPGVVAFPTATGCKRIKILRSRVAWSGHMRMSQIAEVRETGEITFEGSGAVLVPGKDRAVISRTAVRRTFESILSADLLQLSANGGSIHSEGGEWGKLEFRCDGRTLLAASVGPEIGGGRNIDKEVEALGIDRWTIGSDETASVLAARNWNFMNASPDNMRLIDGISENGTVGGILDLARRGVPLTDDAQASVEEHLRANALAIKAQRGDRSAVTALLKSDIRWSRQQLTDALAAAVREGNLTIADELIADGADPRGSRGGRGTTVLMFAVMSGQPDVIAHVLKYDRRVNKQDANSNRPLHYLVGRIAPFDFKDFERSLALLIAAGADVDASNYKKRTALMSARSRIDVAEALIKQGADVNARDEDGLTPLFFARSWLPIVQLLLKHGADVNAKGLDGQTVLNQGAAGDVAALLIERGADVSQADARGVTPLFATTYDQRVVRLLIAKGVDVNARTASGDTALMRCPSFGAAQALLEAGADPYLRNVRGKSAIDLLESSRTGIPELYCGGALALKLWLAEHGRR